MLDSAVLAYFRLTHTRRTAEELRRVHDVTLEALAVYREAGWLARPRLAHPAPSPPTDDRAVRVHGEGLNYEHLTFSSDYQPHPSCPDRRRWMSFEPNRCVHAWVLRHPDPRPWVVAVHGARMGDPKRDMQLFRTSWLHHRLGLNVVMPVLPLHGPRRSAEGHFPSEDMLNNLHGTLQAVSDVRRTIAWIRNQHGDPRIAVHGVSMGGFTTALVAGLEPDLACAILGVAPADLVTLLERHHGAARSDDLRRRNFELGARLGPMISPLGLEPLVPKARRFIYAGIADQLVDFGEHVAPMIAHWDEPETLVYDGGHVGSGLAREVPGFVARALASSGLIPPRPASAASRLRLRR